jgi:hypothetical protein
MDAHDVYSRYIPGSSEIQLFDMPEYLNVLVEFRAFSNHPPRILYHRQASSLSAGAYCSFRLTVIIYRYIPFIIIGLIGFCVGNDRFYWLFRVTARRVRISGVTKY